MKSLLIIVLLVLSSCSAGRMAERRAIKTGDHDLNELVESWYETVWNPQNNRKGERDSIELLIREHINK